jgi:hypothetical protein
MLEVTIEGFTPVAGEDLQKLISSKNQPHQRLKKGEYQILSFGKKARTEKMVEWAAIAVVEKDSEVPFLVGFNSLKGVAFSRKQDGGYEYVTSKSSAFREDPTLFKVGQRFKVTGFSTRDVAEYYGDIEKMPEILPITKKRLAKVEAVENSENPENPPT